MTIYISTPCKSEEMFRVVYSQAAEEIKKLGHQPFNPYLGSDGALLPWPFRLEALINQQCQGLYLLQGWCNCVQAVTERHICLAAGKIIMFQSAQERQSAINQEKQAVIEKVTGAIHEATGLTVEEYRIHSRKTEFVFARMIFAHHCIRAGLSPEEIGIYLDRNKSMIYHYLKHYPDECKYTPAFRKIAAQVEQILGVKQQN